MACKNFAAATIRTGPTTGFDIMNKLRALLIFLFVSSASFAADTLPRDVRNFIDNATECEHFAGEVGGDLPKRDQDAMINNINRYCKAAKTQYKVLLEKYKGNASLVKKIKAGYNDTVDSYTED